MSNIKSFIEKRMPFYGVVFNFEPPTDAQLQAEVNRVTMRMVKAFTIGNVVAIACAVIAYNTAFTDTGESFQVFNPLCAIPLLEAGYLYFCSFGQVIAGCFTWCAKLEFIHDKAITVNHVTFGWLIVVISNVITNYQLIPSAYIFMNRVSL